MIIAFSGGSKGWTEYVLNGTELKPREKELIEVIDGDLNLTKTIYENSNYKENYTRGIISFKGKLDNQKSKEVYEDFKKEFMSGYEKEEYNISAIIHNDTDNTHIHFCIPKKNLLTEKCNDYYFDKRDRKRVNLIKEYLEKKYDIEEKIEDKEILKEDKTLRILEKWREDYKQPNLKLNSKRNKVKTEKIINNYLSDLKKEKLINSLEDIKETIKSLGLEVVKNGHDIPNDFYYITIKDDQGKKTRVKGEIYNDKQYTNREENRRTEENPTSRNREDERRNDRGIEEVYNKLQETNKKHRDYLEKRFGKSRKEAKDKLLSNDIYSNGFYKWSVDNKLHTTTKNKNNNHRGNNILQNRKRENSFNRKQLHLHYKGLNNDNSNTTTENIHKRGEEPTKKRENRTGGVIEKYSIGIRKITDSIQRIRERILLKLKERKEIREIEEKLKKRETSPTPKKEEKITDKDRKEFEKEFSKFKENQKTQPKIQTPELMNPKHKNLYKQ